MSSRTTNLNLEKPANTDYVDVDVINSNSDKIDTFAGQVLNGDYVQDSNYVHTDNNFTSTLKNKLDGVEANANNYSLPTASTGTLGGVKVDGSTITIDSNGIISSTGGGGGGTTVIANPSGTATVALEKLQVGQTIYSSGGTTVIGNPSGTATADLEKIQIGNSVFKIPEASLYTPTGLSYTVTMEAVASKTQFDCFLTEYEDGTQTAQNDYSFVKTAAGISEVTVGKVKLQNASGNIQVIALDDMLQYNGSIFNTNDVIATILLPSTNVPAVSMTIEEVEFPVSWNQIQQSGSKIAEITINGTTTDIYAPSGGGGSTVSVTQKTSTGTNIADITVDGVTTQLYAPTSGGATALNDLSDVNINYGTLGTLNVLQYDSATAKWGNAEIPRNLASQGDVTISSATNGQVLKYNSTSNKWENSNESGGTTVVANPQETATDELEKIQIGNIIYSVSSGGGGGTGSGKTLVKKTKTYTGDGQIPLVVTFDEKPLLIYSIYGPGLNESNTVRMYPFVYGETKASGRYINNDSSSGNIGYTIAYSNNDLTMSVTSNPQDAGACLNNNGSSFTITYLVEENTSSGHTILNDSGTELAQEDNLQFKGAYAHDDSTNGATVVEVTRVMTSEEYALLTDAEKKGVIVIEDEPDPSASGFTDYEGTLIAGQTSLTINGLEIDNTKMFNVYTDILGVDFTNLVVTNGQIVLTFPAQQTDMGVLVSVRAKTHVNKPFDIDLSDFVTDKIWKYYDSANWSDATSDGSKITIAGGEERNDWTTATWVCIDLTQYPVPNNLSKLKIHLPSIETVGYSGLTVVTDSDKFGPGSNGGSDTLIRKTRLEISSGIYVLGNPSLGLNETDYTLEIPCTKNELSRYLYIGATDGVNPSDSNTYNNSLNGSFDVEIDGLWYE